MFAFLHHPEIDPVILQISGPLAIRWYSLMYILGFAAVFFYVFWLSKRGEVKLTKDDISDVVFSGFIGLILGARLGYVLFYDLPVYLENPLRIFMVWQGGMSFHGGMIGLILGVLVYCLMKKKNFWDVADIFAVPIPFCLALGRWGNFVNGELWGRVTSVPWGMIFPQVPKSEWAQVSDPATQEIIVKAGLNVAPGQTLINLPRHPSQLYQLSLEGLTLFLILWVISRTKIRTRGFYISTFLLGYGCFRIVAECFRQPDLQLGFIGGGWLTMGMILSIPMVLAGIAGLIYFLKKGEKNALWQ